MRVCHSFTPRWLLKLHLQPRIELTRSSSSLWQLTKVPGLLPRRWTLQSSNISSQCAWELEVDKASLFLEKKPLNALHVQLLSSFSRGDIHVLRVIYRSKLWESFNSFWKCSSFCLDEPQSLLGSCSHRDHTPDSLFRHSFARFLYHFVPLLGLWTQISPEKVIQLCQIAYH